MAFLVYCLTVGLAVNSAFTRPWTPRFVRGPAPVQRYRPELHGRPFALPPALDELRPTPAEALVRAVPRLIHPDASVGVQNNIGAHFSGFANVRDVMAEGCDFYVIDTASYDLQYGDALRTRFRQLTEQSDYCVLYADDRLFVFCHCAACLAKLRPPLARSGSWADTYLRGMIHQASGNLTAARPELEAFVRRADAPADYLRRAQAVLASPLPAAAP